MIDDAKTVRDINKPNPTLPVDLAKYVRFGRVIEVYDATCLASKAIADNYGKIKIVWQDSQDLCPQLLSCLSPLASWTHGSGIFGFPHINDIVATLQLPYSAPVIIGYLPAALAQASMETESTAGMVSAIRPLFSGEILIKASSQSEIFLNNQGAIHVVARDAVNTKDYAVKQLPMTTQPVFSRPETDVTNIVTEVVIGKEATVGGPKLVGCGSTVFSVDRAAWDIVSISLTALKTGQSLFGLPYLQGGQPSEVKEVVRWRGAEAYTLPSDQLLLVSSDYYIKSTGSVTDNSKQPFSFDSTQSSAYVMLTASAAAHISAGDKVVITLIAKRALGTIKLNELGDCELDGRNLVLKTKNGAYLGLFDDGTCVLNGSKVELGDKLSGSITLTRGGIDMSSGINEGASILQHDKGQLADYFGAAYYFAISDSLPLFCYSTEMNDFRVVLPEEYNALSYDIRSRIPYRKIDPDGIGLDKAKITTLINMVGAAAKPYALMRMPTVGDKAV